MRTVGAMRDEQVRIVRERRAVLKTLNDYLERIEAAIEDVNHSTNFRYDWLEQQIQKAKLLKKQRKKKRRSK